MRPGQATPRSAFDGNQLSDEGHKHGNVAFATFKMRGYLFLLMGKDLDGTAVLQRNFVAGAEEQVPGITACRRQGCYIPPPGSQQGGTIANSII